MNELYYGLKVLFTFVIISSFIAWINFDLMKKNTYHGTDFNGIENGFSIHTGTHSNYLTGDIYIYGETIPDQCLGENKKSMLCLKELKNIPSGGYYNGLPYKQAKNFETDEVKIEKIDNTNCSKILKTGGSNGNGIYTINPSGKSEFEVYCDMTTDGGGWTYVSMLHNTSIKNLFDTGNSNKILSITGSISTKGNINDFIFDEKNIDIMILCNSDSIYGEKYKLPFIIYDFPNIDINNLIKSNKAGKVLYNGDYIKVKYNGKNRNLGKNWGTSSNNYSHNFIDDNGKILFNIDRGYQFYTRDLTETYSDTPAYYTPRGRTKSFNSTNYCTTAIRDSI